MLGLDVIAATGLLVLAGSGVNCAVPVAPKITVSPVSAPIQYEFSLSSEELGQFKTDTVNPYAPNVDTATGGLRHDRPKINTEVKWGTLSYPDRQVACLWYESVEVTIQLSPKIYVASENSEKTCRDAILNHERKHVAVDRALINRYAQGIGNAVKRAVDQIGAMGPYNYSELETVQDQLVNHIQTAVDSQKFLLHQEMAKEQAKVDSLEEYERVNVICNEAAAK